jgi:hypothetical protein
MPLGDDDDNMMAVPLAVSCVLNSSLAVIMTLSFGFLRLMVQRCAMGRTEDLESVGLGPASVARAFGGLFIALVAIDGAAARRPRKCQVLSETRRRPDVGITILAYTTRPTEAEFSQRRPPAREAPPLIHCFLAASSLCPAQVLVALAAWCGTPLAFVFGVKAGTQLAFWIYYFRERREAVSAAALTAGPSLRRAAAADALVDLYARRVDDADAPLDALCVVCQDDLVVGDTVVRLPCKHVLHASCAREWWNRKPSCPICQAELAHGLPAGARPSPRVSPEPGSPAVVELAVASPRGGGLELVTVEITPSDSV